MTKDYTNKLFEKIASKINSLSNRITHVERTVSKQRSFSSQYMLFDSTPLELPLTNIGTIYIKSLTGTPVSELKVFYNDIPLLGTPGGKFDLRDGGKLNSHLTIKGKSGDVILITYHLI